MKKVLFVVSLVILCTLFCAYPVFATESTVEDEESPVRSETVQLDVKKSATVTITIIDGDVQKVRVNDKLIPEYEEGCNYYKVKLPYGSYILTLSYVGSLEYDIEQEPLDIQPYLSAERIQVVEGFDAELSVNNANSIVSYYSRNSNVAAVSADGKIKAVSAGSTVIEANCGGTQMLCEVVVTSNVYMSDKLTMGDCMAYTTTSKIHRIVYDGNYLKITYRICNNTPATATSRKVTIKLLDRSGMIVLTKTFKKQKCELTPYSVNDYTVKIPCKDLFVLNSLKPVISVKYTYA